MKNVRKWVLGLAAAFSLSIVNPVAAIEGDASQAQIQPALDRGQRTAARHRPPETGYARVGADRDLDLSGFVLMRFGGLSVDVGFSLDFARIE